ncbi:protein kinase domain-containing protein [Gemmatimonas sp.]|uniref:protein kinase domain-containing protein n=1 Tax=Gemmatimonas sp. TaxID=1962908 RepID=UPI0039830477
MTVLSRLTTALADRYRVERELGAGGMATVYLAHDRKHDRKVAIKVLKPELGAVLGAERFLDEIKVTANLQHPNLLPLFDSGASDGLLYYVMPYVEGETLRVRLEREHQLPVDEVVRLATLLAGALDYAHQRGVIHRDLKPENILLQAGQPVIADFGIALAVAQAGGSRITETGLSLGTPHYMSPEQATGDRVIDARSDEYALGAVTYEMLVGEPPHTGATSQVIIARLMTEKPRSVRATRSTVSVAMDQAIERALAKSPADRFSGCGAFAKALTAEASASAYAGVFARRWLAAAGIGGVATVALIAWLMSGRKDTPTVSAAPRSKSIAVLPLVNVGGDSTQEYFADGMADELATALGKLPGLKVAARTSSYAFKGRRDLDVKEVGQKLGVDVVLQGSVRRSGDRMRVSVQLTDAKEGVELWSETYDRDTKDAFAVQDSITAATVRKLSLSLGAGALAATRTGRTTSPAAHDLYLRAQTIASQGTQAALRRALELFRQALAIDPDYAQADAAIAFQYMSLADAYMPSNIAYDSSRTAARRALTRDSLVGDARALIAFADMALNWTLAKSNRELSDAAAREPNSAQTQILYAVSLCTVGRVDEGLKAAKAAITLDPLNALASWTRELCLYMGRRYDQLIAEHPQIVASWPDQRLFYWDSFLGAAYREKGQYAQALAEYERAQQAAGDVPLFGYAVTLARAGQTAKAKLMLEQLLTYGRDHYVNPISMVAVYAAMGDRDEAVAWLDRTVIDRTGWLWGIATWPEFDSLQQDPRLAGLIRRMGLPTTPRKP